MASADVGRGSDGPQTVRSIVLSDAAAAIIVSFRHHTLLPLDDCLWALQATIPHLSRSSLRRCFMRHGINRLAELDGDKPTSKRFKPYPLGYVHIDLVELRTAERKLHLFIAIDRTSKSASAERVDRAATQTATAVLEALVAAVPYRIHTVLTDKGIQFADLPEIGRALPRCSGATCSTGLAPRMASSTGSHVPIIPSAVC